MDSSSQASVLTQHRITVLLVDDQMMVIEAVRRMLEGEDDIDFHFCRNPTDAVKSAVRITPTVILQDLVMPEMDGLLLVRYFRANPATREIPLIVLSSKEEPDTKAKAFSLGANDYMVKLPDRLEVLARIRYHSRGYIALLERNEAYEALLESRRQLEIRNRFIRKTFGRYLSDDVVNSILESPEGTRLGGEKRRVTVMMTDLRGFTSVSERLPPEHVVSILNIYLETMTGVILRYQGVIDEFIGDAILVIFGAPIFRDDDAQRAVACAVEMQQAMDMVNARMREAGYPEVAQGIGINTGDVVVGNIGSEKRSKYGVVGQTVNLTSRIESYTVGGQILVSGTTCEACGNILEIGETLEVMPKGVREPITIYEIKGIGGEYNVFLSRRDMPEWHTPDIPLTISFTVLEGKHMSANACSGQVIRLSPGMAEIRPDVPVARMHNLRLALHNGNGRILADEIYGKVTQIISESPPVFLLTFTAVPPEGESCLRTLCRREGG